MLSIMNEIDPCLLLLLCVLYEIQNQFYQQFILIMCHGEGKKKKKNSYVLAFNGSSLTVWILLGLGRDNPYYKMKKA